MDNILQIIIVRQLWQILLEAAAAKWKPVNCLNMYLYLSVCVCGQVCVYHYQIFNGFHLNV